MNLGEAGWLGAGNRMDECLDHHFYSSNKIALSRLSNAGAANLSELGRAGSIKCF
jgi:hypothetical protein